jgi:UDPglucose 6-dehydrogenase
MKVGIIGNGVIGGALASVAASKGFLVSVYDKYQPKLDDFKPILKTEIVFLCLPTITVGMRQDQIPVFEVCERLFNEDYDGVVVLRSTVVPGTTDRLTAQFPGLKLVHNPEFLTAAKPKEDLINQPAVILGSRFNDAAMQAREFWLAFDDTLTIHFFQTPLYSEMIKYTHNCFLSVKVGFFNDIYDVCRKLGIQYDDMMEGVHAIGQVGRNHSKVPGPDGKPGFGGMCFPKDTKAFLLFAMSLGAPMDVLHGAVTGNKLRRPDEM